MKKIIRLTESDLIKIVKRVINEQNSDPFYEVVKEFIGKEYEFTSKYKGPDGQTPTSIKGTVKVITKEQTGSDRFCVIVRFTENIVPFHPLSDDKRYDTLIMDCEHGYFWHGCSCEEVGDAKWKLKTEWYNDDLVRKIQQKVCIYI
jgi:hypothetical protein